MRAAAIDLAGRALVYVGLGLVGVLALLVWRGGSVPAWILVAAVAVVGAVGVATRREVARALANAESDVTTLRDELGRHTEYSRHVQNSLDALQRLVSHDVDAEIPYYLEQAVLAPAKSILTDKPVDTVRLSVLLPADDNADRWSMRWAAGHSMIGQLKYDAVIADTLARHAYESGESQYWSDTETQTDFQQNPRASAPTRSMVSIPIQQGGATLGVFNAVAAETDAFEPAEQTFLAALAGVIAVAVSVWREAER